MSSLIDLISPELKFTGVTLKNPHTVSIPAGITAVLGPNGAGKTALANVIENGWNFMTNHIESYTGRRLRVKSIAFSNLHSLTGFTSEYYQQRYESMMNDDVPTVRQLLGTNIDTPLWQEMSARLSLTDTLDKKANYLSSGELRKLLIANMLFDMPELLVLDNPYIGLDATARAVVDSAISEICAHGTSILLLISDPVDIPDTARAVLPVKDLTLLPLTVRSDGETADHFRGRFDCMFDSRLDRDALASAITERHTADGSAVVSMHGCQVRYGSRVIVDGIDWYIKQGECWSLSGPNGSGKSTLLSLINADNPQAYSNDITLFGIRRGSGESIWDIKSRIGFMSSELHLYFKGGGMTVEQIIGRALKDNPADFGPLTERQRSLLDLWIRVFGIDELRNRAFRTLSFGQQRLALLISALAKVPQLLILDEPLHGLDRGLKQRTIEVVDALAKAGITLIYVTHCPDELPKCITHSKKLH